MPTRKNKLVARYTADSTCDQVWIELSPKPIKRWPMSLREHRLWMNAVGMEHREWLIELAFWWWKRFER